MGPPLCLCSLLDFTYPTWSRKWARGRKETAASEFFYAQVSLQAIKFPERETARKTLNIIPVKEAETKEGQQITRGHTARRGSPDSQISALPTDHPGLQNSRHRSHPPTDPGISSPGELKLSGREPATLPLGFSFLSHRQGGRTSTCL